MLMALAGRWVLSPTGVMVIGLVGLIVAWQIDRRVYGNKIAADAEVRVVKKAEEATINATEKGKAAAAKSGSVGGRVLGQRDPTTRND